MNIVLWALQAIGGAFFLLAGSMHTFQPMDKLVQKRPALGTLSPRFVRFIGVSEMLGGVGLILPAATGILPRLTIGAACGVAVLMLCATVFHTTRREYLASVRTVVICLLALVIVFGRWKLTTG